MADKRDKFPEPYNPDGLSEEEAKERVLKASHASLKDFDPKEADEGDKVVELANHASYRVKDLTDHPDLTIATDAQSAIDGTNPGGANYPNGPAKQSTPKQSSTSTTASDNK